MVLWPGQDLFEKRSNSHKTTTFNGHMNPSDYHLRS